ncbi:hypothetical protein RRG08_028689 [Elysia crispata]|uniref:Uncharacterized protein n=1 Tax=Elysia crispata TaxID=231223 RepID=A0AAE1CJT5_9GAST|nr:hypothetical protein RRG08_028689 [Elysia crispata]
MFRGVNVGDTSGLGLSIVNVNVIISTVETTEFVVKASCQHQSDEPISLLESTAQNSPASPTDLPAVWDVNEL